MRIAYVTVHVAPEIMEGGVGRKIISQIAMWQAQGHEASLFSLTPAAISLPAVHQFIFNHRLNLFLREVHRSITLGRMLESIREYRADVIYFRYGLYSFPLHRLFNIAPVIVETNTNDLVEYRQRGKFLYWMNRFTRTLLFAHARGYVVPTHELVGLLRLKAGPPICVISNGVDLEKAQVIPPTNHTTPVLTLVGSPGMNWHGADKLIKLADKYQDLQINIVGYSLRDVDVPIPANVHLLGFLGREALHEILSKTDVACGTLALHRKDMHEACPLKVREALACGIPVILGYQDTDLENVDLETILRIPNTEENVIENAGRIRKFAYEMIGKRIEIESIAPYLDQRQKEKVRLEFFQSILNGQTK
jgi:glycosyltransferase involved in cell wall biosynthesis